MRFVLAVVLALIPVLRLAAQDPAGEEVTGATWGHLLWIVWMIVLAVALLALGGLALRSSTKRKE